MIFKEFRGRKLLIATKHHKEKVLQPILEKELGVKCFVSQHFDTDLLGTFSGEIPREEDAVSTLRKKCYQAMEAEGCDLVVASEGSFGNHPSVFFAPADEEFLMLLDQKNGFEILVRKLSLETNYKSLSVKDDEGVFSFLKTVGFPEHALILRPSEDNFSCIIKGVSEETELWDGIRKMKKDFGSCYLETDMRALYNPTRMKIIEKAGHALIEKLKSRCPHCEMLGFGVTGIEKGLPCEDCLLPTHAILKHICKCEKCGFQKEILYPNGIEKENSMYCDYCNP